MTASTSKASRAITICYALLLSLLVSSLSTPSASAADKVFAVVPKAMNNPFFDRTRDGCKKAQEDHPGLECLYIGPANHSEEEQIRIVQDLITRRVDGIAVSPSNAPAIARVFRQAKAAGIPVITWDSDLLPQDRALRKTYIGTENYQLGVALAKEVMALKPNGGSFALQSGGPSANNLNERIQGFRDTIAGKNWTEVAGSPVYCNDDATLAVQQMTDVLTRYPKLDAFVPVGGWPHFAPQAYRLLTDRYMERIKKNELVIAISDTLKPQIELLKEGRVHSLVGQRPFEMGYQALTVLADIAAGKEAKDAIYTGLDICTAATLSTCLKPGS